MLMPIVSHPVDMDLDDFAVYHDIDLTYVFEVLNRDVLDGRLKWEDFVCFAYRYSSIRKPSDFKDVLRESWQENAPCY